MQSKANAKLMQVQNEVLHVLLQALRVKVHAKVHAKLRFALVLTKQRNVSRTTLFFVFNVP